MPVSTLSRSRLFRSLVLSTSIFSLLLWTYIVIRIVFNDVDVTTPFVDAVPFISFEALGALTFGLSFVCTVLYFWLWGRLPGAPTATPSDRP